MKLFSESEVEAFGSFLISYYIVSGSKEDLQQFVKDALKLFIESREGQDFGTDR